jgi:VWFA-related protein
MRIAWLMALVFGLGVALGWAQDGGDAATPTLHVYTNLIQLPVLVLGNDRQPISPVREKDFTVSLDGGRPFPATHVRVEGDDPIELAILVDLSGSEQYLLPVLADAVAGLAPGVLHPRDRVSVYGVDCTVVRSVEDAPADAAALRKAVQDAIDSPYVHGPDAAGASKAKGSCGKSLHLWDALGSVTAELSQLPGRRVIVALTDGHDRGSLLSAERLMWGAELKSVAIFGVEDDPGPGNSAADFQSVAETTGGMVLAANGKAVGKTLQRLVGLVRGRYIVEFPRPDALGRGGHNVHVGVAKPSFVRPYFVRWGGITVPAPNQAVLDDPTTVKSDPTLAPEVGNKKAVGPK